MAKRPASRKQKPPQYGDLCKIRYWDHAGGWGDTNAARISLRCEHRHWLGYRKIMGVKFLVTARVDELDDPQRYSDWDAYVASAIHSVEVMERATRA